MKKINSINLIITKKQTTTVLRRIKFFFPVVSAIFFILFLLFYIVSIYYLNLNSAQFHLLKKQIDSLEKQISSLKNIEGIYTLTVTRAGLIEKILSISKNYSPALSEINNLSSESIVLTDLSIDEKNNVSLTLSAMSVQALDELVFQLQKKEEEKFISNIISHGAFRDKNGQYTLKLSFIVNPALLIWKK